MTTESILTVENNMEEQTAVTVGNIVKAPSILTEHDILEDQNKTMRTAFIRISEVNLAKADNPELGVKAGDTVIYTFEDVLNIIYTWQRTKKFDFYAICHNKEKDENQHTHLVLVFPDNSTTNFQQLKRKFPYGDIETCKSKVRNCVRYLCHADNLEKTQYEWDEIVTNNKPKLEEFKLPGNTSLEVKTKIITDKILAGELREFEIEKIPHEVYTKKYSIIMRSFEYRRKLLLADPTRNIEIIVLQGKTRLGKSTYCNAYAEKHGKSFLYSSGGKDFFGEYLGQDVVVLDDFDFDTITINDLKKIIDPFYASSVPSRYHNKLFIGDTIFICTNQDITTLYPLAEESDRAAVFERIRFVLNFQSYSDMILSTTTDLSLHDDLKIPEYSDGASYYTINKIVPTDSYKDVLDKKGFTINSYRERKLEPVDGAVHEFDLKKYITADEKRGEDLLGKLTEI